MQAESMEQASSPSHRTDPATAPATTPGAASPLHAAVRHAAAAFLVAGAAWDLGGVAGMLPPWWPPAGYLLVALGIGMASVAVLLRILLTPRDAPRRAGMTLLQLIALGALLAALTLRGHAEVPPDPPLVAAEVVATATIIAAALIRRRKTR